MFNPVNSIHIITDCIIAVSGYYAIGCLIAAICIIKKARNRKAFSFIILIVSSIYIIGLLYSGVIEPQRILVRSQSIDISDYTGEKPLRIVLISDLHVGRFYNSSNVKRAVEKISTLENIDAVLVLGDLVNQNSDHLSDLDPLKEIENENVFFVYGNHDYDLDGEEKSNKKAKRIEGLEDKINDLGLKVLSNNYQYYSETKNVVFSGIDDSWAKRDNPDFIKEIPEDTTNILLCHSPDCAIEVDANAELKSKVDLIVSGHTHGGEMRFPLIGSLAPQGLPIELPQEYDKGLKDYHGIKIFITSGIGNIGVRLRTFNNPEIVILEIT